MKNHWLLFLFGTAIALTSIRSADAQSADAMANGANFDISNVYRSFNSQQTAAPDVIEPELWWDRHVAQSQRNELPPIGTDIHSLMYLALKYSNQVRIAAEDPLIQETAIAEADSNFDWVRYLNTSWNDTSEPTSTTLIAGDQTNRFNDHQLQAAAGLRRNTRSGGQFDISQRFGYQDNNSDFFVPGDQATGQLTVSFNQPLLRGRGQAYNNSLVFLAQLDTDVAHDDFRATLQSHLLEVARAYWLLYQERAVLAQQVKLYLKTESIVEILRQRQLIDAQRTQFITASSALATRKSDLIRARTAVINAETRLRGLINAPELANSDQAELVPIEFPSMNFFPVDLRNEIQVSMQNRPEVQAAIKQIRSGATRLGIAQHELLPVLNLATQAYANGLRGSSDFGGAFEDQFSGGSPSYSIGLQYELPVGNRLARARLCRRQIELRQLERQYSQALQAIQVEVDIAVREVVTAHSEIRARSKALAAAVAEAGTIEARWKNLIDGSGTSSLNLESLLRAQERVTDAEREYVTSLLTYNLSTINLRRANGTLLQSENVSISRPSDGCHEPLHLDKHGPSNSSNYLSGNPTDVNSSHYLSGNPAEMNSNGQFNATSNGQMQPFQAPVAQTQIQQGETFQALPAMGANESPQWRHPLARTVYGKPDNPQAPDYRMAERMSAYGNRSNFGNIDPSRVLQTSFENKTNNVLNRR